VIVFCPHLFLSGNRLALYIAPTGVGSPEDENKIWFPKRRVLNKRQDDGLRPEF
jgi:hypothetical protein